jgi:predicted nucleotidyltransferase
MIHRPRDRHWLRHRAAIRAAELMYFEGVKEYLRAKRKASRHVGHRVFPNNREIRDELDRLAEVLEGPARKERLLDLRLLALEVMEVLEEFEPRLIGSVLTGHIRRTSDVDLHAFSDHHPLVEECLLEAGFDLDFELVKTEKGGRYVEFPHYYLQLSAGVVEVSVYPRRDLRRPQRSSITHRTMQRATLVRVRQLIEEMRGLHSGQPEETLCEDVRLEVAPPLVFSG